MAKTMSGEQLGVLEESKKKRNRGPTPLEDRVLPAHAVQHEAPTTTEALSVLDDELRKVSGRALACEQILIRAVRTGQPWGSAEHRLLEDQFGEGLHIESQRARVTRALAAREICRGPSYFNKVVQQERSAIALYEREYPIALEKVLEAQEVAASIARVRDEALAATDKVTRARVQVLQSEPPFLVNQSNRQRAAIEAEYHDVVTAAAEIHWRISIADITDNRSMAAHLHGRRLNGDENLPTPDPRKGEIPRDAWARYVNRRQREVQAMEPGYLARKAERDAKIEELQASSSYYYKDAPV
jgi:hypothetical protein